MFERILVPLDGSKTAEMVFPYLIEIASRYGSQIILVSVSESNDSVFACRSYLENMALVIKNRLNEQKAKRQTVVDFTVLLGNPPIEILDYATDAGCDLIILSSRGATKQNAWPLGNVADKILSASNIPVLLIRKNIDGLISGGNRLIKRILVNLDGSNLSEIVLPIAEEMSKTLQAEINLFRVAERSTFLTTMGIAMINEMPNEIALDRQSDLAKSEATDYLNKIKDSLAKKEVKASIAMGEGPIAEQILNYAEKNEVDLIAMSTHGRSGMGRWVFGSITDKVIHAGDKPIMVVRPKKVR